MLRALFEWICDNNCTPYLLVDATLEGVEVPAEHINGGRIVLNASATAVANFSISNEAITFNTRFSGRDTWINVPMAAVLAIYAKETQEGMTFAPADYPESQTALRLGGIPGGRRPGFRQPSRLSRRARRRRLCEGISRRIRKGRALEGDQVARSLH